jgi:hypothetical protein
LFNFQVDPLLLGEQVLAVVAKTDTALLTSVLPHLIHFTSFSASENLRSSSNFAPQS